MGTGQHQQKTPEISPPAAFVQACAAPGVPALPLLVCSPHSGRDYPPELLAASRLSAAELRRSEDAYVDLLCAGAPAAGAGLLAARTPRAWCDFNRDPRELDPLLFSGPLPAGSQTRGSRVAAGLGVIARVVGPGMPIYAGQLPAAEAARRIAQSWQPFHAAITGTLAQLRQAAPRVLLLDMHSMPQMAPPGPEIVVGDAHGLSAAAELSALVCDVLRGAGFTVGRNAPYAGGYITRSYGRPARGVHALQIEILRSVYMDEAALAPHAGFARVRAALDALFAALAPVLGVLGAAAPHGPAACAQRG